MFWPPKQLRGIFLVFLVLVTLVPFHFALAQSADSEGVQDVELSPAVSQLLNQARDLVRARRYEDAVALFSDPQLADIAQAQYMFATLLRAGRGVTRDDARAFDLTQKAAEQGYTDAQFSLGKLFMSGRGIEPDPAKAEIWLERATLAGHRKSAALLDRLRKSMEEEAQATDPSLSEPPLPEPAQSGFSRGLGWTPLIEAARRGQVQLLPSILNTNSNVDERDASGMTALHHAALAGQETTLLRLVELGASLEAQDNKGYTTLAQAVRAGQVAMVKRLLGMGADKTATAGDERTLLELALQGGQCEIAGILVQAGSDIPPDRRPEFAIQSARKCNREVLLALNERQFPILVADAAGRSTLWHAVSAGNMSAVQYLLTIKADPNRKTSTGDTPFLAAVFHRSDTMSRALITAGADLHIKTQRGTTPLMLAVQWGNAGLVRDFIRMGADVDVRNHLGMSALMLASRSGQKEIVMVLMQAGADTSLRNKKREQAVDLAIATGHQEIADLLGG